MSQRDRLVVQTALTPGTQAWEWREDESRDWTAEPLWHRKRAPSTRKLTPAAEARLGVRWTVGS